MDEQVKPNSPSEPLAADLSCLRCRYNLRGLSPESACPECGLSVERTLRGGLLKFSPPAHVARVRQGAELVLFSFLFFGPAAVALWLICISGTPGGSVGNLTVSVTILLLMIVVAAAAPALLLAGWWLITGPDLERQGIEGRCSARRVTRALTLVVAALYLALLLIIVFRRAAPALLTLVGGCVA
ncbi:MAG: hypothetical protein ACF8NJ_02245, partial [Phycisphaerales bacterium JB038]